MLLYPSLHTHSEYSNIRLLDSINRMSDMLKYSKEIGLNGIALTDHECLSGSIKAMSLCKEYKKKGIIDENFKLMIGDEIYLVEDIKQRQMYHFILIAKDRDGYELLKRISTKAWENSYNRGKMTRVPIKYNELFDIVNKNKGHLIGATACLGGQFAQLILQMNDAEKRGEVEKRNQLKAELCGFIEFMKDLFGEDFYFEIQSSNQKEQVIVNKWIKILSPIFNTKIIITTDAHYLKKEDRYAHKAYLTSKEGDREVDSFYETTYLMSTDEMQEYKSIKDVFTKEEFEEIILNTNAVKDKCEEYDVYQVQQVPLVNREKEVKELFKKNGVPQVDYDKYKNLKRIIDEKNANQLYWWFRIYNFLQKKELVNETYIARIDLEAEELFGISERMGQSVFDYYVTMTKIMEIAWNDANAIVGVSRGSVAGYLSAYALEIQGCDPIKYGLPHWRHLSKERPEMPDVDFDTPASRRTNMILATKNYFGKDNVINIGTFKTEGSKSAILTACRGYRSEEYPNGIDSDIGQFLSSMIKVERGKAWSISDTVYGNIEKDRQPVKEFVKEVEKYEGLLDIIFKIEGLVCGRSVHASGVYIYNEPYVNYNAMMKTTSGQEVTQFDMADSDYQGGLKFDYLTIEALDLIQTTLELLIKEGYVEIGNSLKETYDNIIGPDVLVDSKEFWDIASQRRMLSCFQFDTAVGGEAIAKVKPNNLVEAAQANSLMRLMATEKGGETPVDKFVRFKNNPKAWQQEMDSYGLTNEEQNILREHFGEVYGVAATQEDLMLIVMDERVAGFDVVAANKLRKAIAKKKEALMNEMKDYFFIECEKRGTSLNFANYVWQEVAIPQAGYSFSKLHTTGYTMIALQELTLFHNYPEIFWNTGVLTVNSASVPEVINPDFIEQEYDEDGNEIEEKKKAQTVNYGKLAKALGEIIKAGIKIASPNINSADNEFKPDVDNNRILYSLKALSGVGDKEVEEIFEKRPFVSLNDFLTRVKIKKPAIISLIKSGAFDELENKDRKEIMEDYISIISGPKTKLNLQNFKSLIDKNMIPAHLDFYRRLFNFNKYIRQKQFKKDEVLLLDEIAQNFMNENYPSVYAMGMLTDNNLVMVGEKAWKKVYDKEMDTARQWLKDCQEELLTQYNQTLFNEQWVKYCLGTVSKWEMDSMSFYWHEHELKNVNIEEYGISNFSSLPEEPVIDRIYEFNGRQVPTYKLTKIIGTCIDKNNMKNTFTLLTPDGEVVDIRLNTEHFALYNKQISELNEDGTKTVKEKSWFSRGNKLMVVGFRRGTNFIPKKYKNTPVKHRLFLITEVDEKGDMLFTSARYGAEEE